MAVWLGGLFLALLVAGCATRPQPQSAIFFPPPPAAPRLQYLTSYSRPEDLEPPKGAFFTFLVGRLPPKTPIIKPYGIAVGDDELLICDTVAATVHVLDLTERKWTPFSPIGAGRLAKPINIAVGKNGTRYVADAGRGEVLLFDRHGTYQGAIGKTENAKPTDVAVTGKHLYIADVNNHNVAVYHISTRRQLFAIPHEEEDDKTRKLFAPTNLALDDEDNLYVSDTGAFRVQQYDAAGTFLRTFGRHGDAAGEFARNKGVAVDREGRVYVVDAASQTVQVFDQQGALLIFFGEPGGSTVPLALPAGIAIDYDHVPLFRKFAAPGFDIEYLVFVTSQYGPRKVSVYGFGHQQ